MIVRYSHLRGTATSVSAHKSSAAFFYHFLLLFFRKHLWPREFVGNCDVQLVWDDVSGRDKHLINIYINACECRSRCVCGFSNGTIMSMRMCVCVWDERVVVSFL